MTEQIKAFEWTVIGAGPAGIAAVGKLLDYNVKPKTICWIDPHFTVGDFGTLWNHVPSNTKVSLFLDFLNGCSAFNFIHSPGFPIKSLKRTEHCLLQYMSEPLQWVTDHLKKTVVISKNIAEELTLANRLWHIQCKDQLILSKNVVLAIGAESKTLAHSGPETVSLAHALNPNMLKNTVNKNDTVAVFGSSHSATLVLKNLVEFNVKKIINFFRSPLVYAVYLNDSILFDDTGLKGSAAQWAHENIDGKWPENLSRIYSNQPNIEHYLPQCDKVIYAVGLEKRTLPILKDYGHISSHHPGGIIAPGLFGIGIAFPEARYNQFNQLERRVGLWKFMDYINRVLPIWLKYST